MDTENKKMNKTTCIYSGRFQPFGKHHKAVYESLKEKFDKVYITTTDESAPLNFREKKMLMEMQDIPIDEILPVHQLNTLEEIKSKCNLEDSALVFAMGKKALKEFKVKMKGNKKLYKLLEKTRKSNLKHCDEAVYIHLIPEMKIKLEESGDYITSSNIREAICSGDQKKFRICMGFYNPALHEFLMNKFKQYQQETKVNESLITDIIEETIIKRGNKYCLISKKTHRNLGCYPSRSGAEKRERQVQYFKRLKEMSGMAAGSVAIGTKPLGTKEET